MTGPDGTVPHRRRSASAEERPSWRILPDDRSRRTRRFWTLGSMFLALAVCGAIAFGWRHSVLPKRWGVIEEDLVYRSGQLSRNLVRHMLQRHGIRTIVDLTTPDAAHPDKAAQREAARDLGIDIVSLPLSGDGRGDIMRYAEAIAVVSNAVKSGTPVLLHCSAGAQRTGGITACYRMLVQGWSVEQALAEMRRYGWCPRRNPDLAPFLNDNMESLALELVRRGVIEDVPDPLPLLP